MTIFSMDIYIVFFSLFTTILLVALVYIWLQLTKYRNVIKKSCLDKNANKLSVNDYFEVIFDNIKQLNGLIAPDGTILAINAPALEIFQATKDEIIGIPFIDCPRWRKGTPLHERMKRLIAKVQLGHTVNLQLTCRDTLNKKQIIDCSLKPSFDKNNKLLYIIAEGHDITKLKNAQKEIAREKEFTDAVVESLPGIFYVFDEKNELIRWNKNLEKHSGFAPDELMHKHLLAWFTNEDKKIILSRVKDKTLNSPVDLPLELRGLKKDGSNPVYLYSSKDVTIDGKKYLIGTAFDISYRKKNEKELQQAQKMESLGTLAGGIAHDFNNILSAIIGYTELSQIKAADDTQISQYLSGIQQAAIRARDLVKQILIFTGKREQKRQPVQIAPLIEEAVRLVRSSIPSTVKIHAYIEAREAMVFADATQLHQVMVNLCTNGYQAIGEKDGEITISLKTIELETDELLARDLNLTPGEYIQCRVSDNGEGIHRKDLQRIFEPYFTTKETGKGTGLGLALVDSIIKKHKGTVTVRSLSETGTDFTFYLPVLSEKIPEDSLHTSQHMPMVPGKGKTIICVDDEPFILKIFDSFLSDQGYQTILFNNGTEALAFIKDTHNMFDLLVTDQTMPGLTGLELGKQCFRLRPQVPVILCTGYSNVINKEEALQLGFKAYLDKPVVLAHLSQNIERLLQHN